MEYWEEQQLKQTGYFEEAPKPTAPDPKFGEPALEKTLENVKKTLWDVERHTSDTQSRLDKNNQSGPSYYAHKMSKWSDNNWILDMISETLVEIQSTLETSSIARHSKSPLETSLDSIKEATVSFNEKTMRWHDDQTNLMVKGSDPRVEATKLKPAPSAVEEAVDNEMVTEKKMGLGVLAGFLEEISKGMKLVVHKLYNAEKMSAEDEKEGKTKGKNAAKEEKDQGNSLKGIWNSIKEGAKKNWFVENWGKIAAVLFFLFAPLKWIRKIWDWVKVAWDFTKKHPLIAAMVALGAVIVGPLNLIKLGLKAITGSLKLVWKLLKGIPTAFKGLGKFFKGIPNFFSKTLPSALGKAVGTVKKGMTQFFGKNGFLQKTLPGALGKAVGTAKRWGRQGIEGVKSFGGTMKKGVQTIGQGVKAAPGKIASGVKAVGGKLGDMASSTKGIFGSLVKKFGSAGKWIMKLGSKLIMPLVTTPIGWAILAGLAIGALAYIFWDDIKKIWGKITGFISETFSKVAEFAKNLVGSARSMLGNFLRSVGAGMIADWIDPDGADKKKPAKEFTFGGFMEELWAIYSGIWKKIFGAVKKMAGAIGNFGIAVLKGLGAPEWLINMLGGGKKKEPEKVEQPSGEVTEKTDKSRRAKFKKDQAAKNAAEEKGYLKKSRIFGLETGGIASINREAMTRDLNNGELTRDMLVAMLDSGDLSKKRGKKGAVDETASDYEYVETALKLFPAPKPVKKAEVIHGSTGDEPGTTAPVVSKPPRSDFKTPDVITDYRKWKKMSGGTRLERAKAAGNKKEAITNLVDMLKDLSPSELKTTLDSMGVNEVRAVRVSGLAKDLEGKHPAFPVRGRVEMDETEGGPADIKGLTASMKADEAAFKKGGHAAVAKLNAAQSPDDKMNTFNSVQEKNRTLQEGKSGSTTVVNTTNAQSTNVKGGDLLATVPKAFAAPRLTESLNDPVY